MTRRSISLPTLVLAILLVAACRSQERPPQPTAQQVDTAAFDLSAMRKVIEAQNDHFTKAHVTGDIAAIDAMFTRDATSFPPGADAAIGLAAIHALTADYLKAGVSEFREDTTDFYGNQDLLIDAGTYVMTYGADQVTERGKYLNVWKQEDGTWKIHANIWNTNALPTQPK
jgi:ketosteroid isomerase-like protein